MVWLRDVRDIETGEQTRVLFIQQIGGITNQKVLVNATIIREDYTERQSVVIGGDVNMLK